MKRRARYESLLIVITLLTFTGCAEQNPLPPEILSRVNSFGHSETNPAQPDTYYTGEYLCDQGTTGLKLQILGGQSDREIYGIFHFFPVLTNPDVPAGSFVVKGLLDEQRGLINMEPVSWITRPAGFTAVGLHGASTDNGDTFEGQITGSLFSCSTFVIKKATKS
jgi:hypothetical protein